MPDEVELTDQPAPEEFDELYAIDGSAMLKVAGFLESQQQDSEERRVGKEC